MLRMKKVVEQHDGYSPTSGCRIFPKSTASRESMHLPHPSPPFHCASSHCASRCAFHCVSFLPCWHAFRQAIDGYSYCGLPFQRLNKRCKKRLDGRLSDLFQFVKYPNGRPFHLYDSFEINGCSDDDRVAGNTVDCLFQLLHLLIAVAHCGQQDSDTGICFKGLLDLTFAVWPWIDDFRSSELPRRHGSGTELHFAVSQGWTVFNDQDTSPRYQTGVFHLDWGSRLNNHSLRIHRPNVFPQCEYGLRFGRIDLVDDYQVGQSQVRFAGIVVEFVPDTQGGGNNNCKIR